MARGGNAAKQKGSAYERVVAKRLSEITGESFMRAPGSGAFIGGKNAGRKEILHEGQIRVFKGDVAPGPSYSNFNIECKSYKSFPFHKLITNDQIPLLNEWIDQMLSVADEDDNNILFMKFNNIGEYVLWNKDGGDLGYDPYGFISSSPPVFLQGYMYQGTTWTFTSYPNFEKHFLIPYVENIQSRS